MRRVITTAIVAALLGGSALAYADDTGDKIKNDAEQAGTAVKEGAVKAGEAVKQGAVQAGEFVKNGAIDLWQASKAAVGAGSSTFDKRREQRAHGEDPDTGH